MEQRKKSGAVIVVPPLEGGDKITAAGKKTKIQGKQGNFEKNSLIRR